MAITASGIGSGMDIAGLVSQLVAAEGQPATFRLDNKEAQLQSDLSAFGALKGALSKFQDSVDALNDLESFQARTTLSSNTDLFSASSDTTAVAGSYDIEISQLAEAAKVRSGDFASGTDVLGSGTLEISIGTDSFQVAVDVGHTLEDVRDSINAATDNPGITASIINVDDGVGGTASRLILSSDQVGATNAIDVVATDTDGADGFDLTRLATANLTVLQPAQDSIIFVDQQQVTRDSNSFSDVIQGVSFTLKDSEPGTTETLTVALDTGSVTGKVNSFAGAYNSLVETMNSLASYDADAGASGPLLGDSVLRGVQSQIRQALTNSVSGLDFGTLAEIGVSTNENGKLEVDSEKLTSVMDTDFEAVSQLFASENGLASSLSSLLERYTDSDGVISSRTDGIQTRISNIGDDRERLSQRLVALEARYQAQFTAMDMLVGQLQSTSSFLTAQIANLPKPNSIGSN